MSPMARQGLLCAVAVLIGGACDDRSTGPVDLDGTPSDFRAVQESFGIEGIDLGKGPCPNDMAHVPAKALCVDRYEASTGPEKHAVSQPLRLPWVMVTWEEALLACNGAGKRLCHLHELQAACSGPQNHLYPYGKEYEPGKCNDGSGIGNNVSLTGIHAGCQGGYVGLWDMVGNVKEWTTMCNMGSHWCQLFSGSFRDAKDKQNCSATTSINIGFDFGFKADDIGFRCCRSVPGS